MTEKQRIIQSAHEQGIVDVDPANLGTIKLAIELMKKHGHRVFRELEERRKMQKKRVNIV